MCVKSAEFGILLIQLDLPETLIDIQHGCVLCIRYEGDSLCVLSCDGCVEILWIHAHPGLKVTTVTTLFPQSVSSVCLVMTPISSIFFIPESYWNFSSGRARVLQQLDQSGSGVSLANILIQRTTPRSLLDCFCCGCIWVLSVSHTTPVTDRPSQRGPSITLRGLWCHQRQP